MIRNAGKPLVEPGCRLAAWKGDNIVAVYPVSNKVSGAKCQARIGGFLVAETIDLSPLSLLSYVMAQMLDSDRAPNEWSASFITIADIDIMDKEELDAYRAYEDYRYVLGPTEQDKLYLPRWANDYGVGAYA